MPFNVDNPPDKIRKLPKNKQRQWVEVFNSCWEKHHDDAKCHAMAWGVAKKAADTGEEVEHNEKYDTAGCGCCGAAREMENIAGELQDVEPKLAATLMVEARMMVAESKGTVEVVRNSIFCRKAIGQANLSVFSYMVNNTEQEFLKDLRLACELVTSYAVTPNDIRHVSTMVDAWHNTPGAEVIADITQVPDDLRWNVLKNLERKGYRIRG